jgi:hypothetical protein
MKIVQSAGGPLIGLELDCLHSWGGVSGRTFVDAGSPLSNDYEATAGVTNTIGKLKGASCEGLLIAMPFETAIIESDGNSVYIAQAECAEPDWSFSDVKMADFERADFLASEDVRFRAKGGRYVVFDSAYPASQIGDDCLTFNLSRGSYTMSFSLYDPSPEASLLLYRIRKTADE